MPTPRSSPSGLQKPWVLPADWDPQEGEQRRQSRGCGTSLIPTVAYHLVSFKAAG